MRWQCFSFPWAWRSFRSRTIAEVASLVNTLVAPLTIALLYGVSESTQVTVAASGAVYHYPWLPAWLAGALTVGVLVWLARGLLRSITHTDLGDLERRALVLVVAPVGLFLLVAFLPGAIGTMNLFEEGQVLAGAEIVRDGAFPWRDLLVVHGLLHDVGTGLIGSAVIENSRWGVIAGEKLLIVPLSWVALYYLCAYLFWSNWLYLFGTQLLVITGSIFAIHYRLGLIPLVLLLLAALLHRPTVVRAVAFTTLLFVQVVVTPEALWAIPAYLLVIFLFEFFYRDRRRRLAESFRRTWLVVASAGALALAWSVFLLAYGALDDFVFSYRAFVPGHQLTGGVPLGIYRAVLDPGNVGQRYEEFGILAPVVVILGAILFFVARTRLRRPFAVSDWVVLAAVAFVVPYYAKFLSRTDHVYHSFAMAVPVLLYAVYRLVTFAEASLASAAQGRGATWFPRRHALTLPILIVLLLGAPVALRDVLRDVPSHFVVTADEEPELEALGFARRGENDVGLYRDVGRALGSQLEPGDEVFDFTNTPGLIHYVLGYPPSTRYYHVSIAIRQRTQTDLVRLLEKARPKVVVFSAASLVGSPSVWDNVSNQVRHYDVSEWLLDHYVPVLESRTFVLMRRREDGVPARRQLYFDAAPCDWGYVPNFFSPSPAPDAAIAELKYRRVGQILRIRGWAVDPDAGTAAREVVAKVGGKVVARVHPDQRRFDIAFLRNRPGQLDSGFGIAIPARQATGADLRVYAIMASGEAKELSVGADTPQTGLNLIDKQGMPAAESVGTVESVDISRPLALALPADASTYRWLEVRTGEPLNEGSFELSDRLDESRLGSRMISFKTLDRGETVTRIRVGACSQWRGFGASTVYLIPSPTQDVRGVRLLR